jgi:hypothetical protein
MRLNLNTFSLLCNGDYGSTFKNALQRNYHLSN